MPDFSLPDPKDENFNSKVVDLLRQLFDSIEAKTRDYSPIETPQDALQVGTTWLDSTDGKLRVNTSEGVKIVKYE